MSITP